MKKFRIIARSDLDADRWNVLCSNGAGSNLYAQRWYLDAMTQKSWSAVVMGDYDAVLPFYRKKKWLIPYVLPPLLCQRLGILGTADVTQRKLLYEYLLKQGCKVTLCTDDDIDSGMVKKVRNNHILHLNDSYVDLRKKYNRNTSRNLNDFIQSGQYLASDCSVSDCCRFLAKYDPTGLVVSHHENIETLITHALNNGIGHILTATNHGVLTSVAFYIVWHGRIYFLLCGSDASGKQVSATYAIIDAILQKFAGSGLLFDFTGSGIPGVARRNEGFGAITETYWQYHKNRI
jgi:hypothetical protein